MASIWILIDNVPVDDFMPSIVVPFLRALGEHGIHANLEPTTNHIFQNEGTLAYALFPGGGLVFIFTTGPTHNPISGTVDSSRYMMADVKGIPQGLGITESDVSDAIRQFHTGLIEREIYGGRPRIIDGNSIGGALTTETYPACKSESPAEVAQPVAAAAESPQESVATAPLPPSPTEPHARSGNTEVTDSISRIEGKRLRDGAHDLKDIINDHAASRASRARRIREKSHPSDDTHSNAAACKKRGCYIATAVYGDYDHPQVRVLRRFRDQSLSSSRAGRFVIHTYYKVGPLLVQLFGPCRWFSAVCRLVLNGLVARLQDSGISDADYTDSE